MCVSVSVGVGECLCLYRRACVRSNELFLRKGLIVCLFNEAMPYICRDTLHEQNAKRTENERTQTNERTITNERTKTQCKETERTYAVNFFITDSKMKGGTPRSGISHKTPDRSKKSSLKQNSRPWLMIDSHSHTWGESVETYDC